MKKISSKYIKYFSFVFLAGVVLSLGFYIGVQAYAGTIYGREEFHGYFNNNYDAYGDYVLPVISNNQAIPDRINTVSEFMNFLKNYYNNGTNQERTGAAFIYNTIYGKNAPGTGKSISSNEWNALENYLNNDANINWGANVSASINSYYQGSGSDDAFFTESRSEPGILITNKIDSSVAYKIMRRCANPIGKNAGAKTNWVISPTVKVLKILDASGNNTGSLTTAKPGDTITWQHVIKNNGPDSTDRDVIYDSLNSQYLGSGNGPDKTQQSGLPKDRTSPVNDYLTYYTVPKGVKNVTVCRATRVWPYASNIKSTTDYNSSVGKTSPPACVTIGTPPPPPPPQSSICRPIVVVVKPVTYPAVSHTAPNGATYYSPATTVPVEVYINGVPYGIYTTVTRIDLTKKYTTGDQYTVTMKEVAGHVSSYTDNYTTDYNSPIYASDGKTVIGYNLKYVSTSTNTTPAALLSTSTIGPCYDYTLTANTNPLSVYAVEVGASINIRPYVTSDPWTETGYPSFYQTYRTHTKSKPSKWQITRMIFPPDTLPPSYYVSGGISSVDPCSYFDPGNVSTCSSQLDNNSTIFGISGNPSTDLNSTYTVPDDLAGTKICFAFSVFPNQSDPLNTSSSWGASDQWYHSTFDPKINCVVVAKHPKAQIWGGDLWTGGNVDTSTTVKSSSTFGSWSEYGILAAGGIKGAASGAAYAGPSGPGLANATTCNESWLSFTNTPGLSTCNDGTDIGHYSNTTALPDVAASFSGGTPLSDTSITPSSLDSGTYTANNLTLNQSTLPTGKSIIIKASGTVTIAEDQTYNDGPYTSISQLPQLVIIANKIIINNNVTKVDAWLVATNIDGSGSIKTCEQTDKLTIDTCSHLLIVNGPVITNHLYLSRTAGSGIDKHSGDPAEIFNLRADAYLWAYNKASNSGRIRTTYITELPPRF